MFLGGDVGGTKTLLGLFQSVSGGLRVVREASFPSQQYPSLSAIIGEFLKAGGERPSAIAVGVAGPVVGGRSQVVNLRWPVEQSKLIEATGVSRVRVLNDLEATAWGIPELTEGQLESLTPDLVAGEGNAALIAAGTGLGMAILFRDGPRFRPSASEGGHQEFGPRDDLEIDLLRFLRERHGRVSTERVVSGPGFSAIYQFLVESGRGEESRLMSERLAAAPDRNAAISIAGVAGDDPTAERAVDLWVSLYGSAAGDLALVAKATGGMYIGGGIAPKMVTKLRGGAFVRSFRTKGRLSPLLERIPVKIVLEPRTALLGAAARARTLIEEQAHSTSRQ